jgi:N-acetylmuramoyl-L-alanine amidase
MGFLVSQARSIGGFILNRRRDSRTPLHHVAREQPSHRRQRKSIYAFDDLVVLKAARMPTVLLECGVMVNRAEEEKLNSTAYRKHLVDAFDRAIQGFCRSTSRSAGKAGSTSR